MSLPAIRRRYGVPAKRGGRVTFEGRPARITAASGHHLRLRLDGEKGRTGRYHPLWRIDYLDGIDHGAAYDRRVEALLGPGSAASTQEVDRGG